MPQMMAYDCDHSYESGCCDRPWECHPPVQQTRAFSTGATRDTDSNKLDYEGFISPLVTRAFAEYMHRCRTRNVPVGSAIRDSDNWQKGLPQDVYAKSLIRHVVEFWLIHDGFEARDEKGQVLALEDVCCAILFNVQGFLFEELKKTAPLSRLPSGTPNDSAADRHTSDKPATPAT